MSKVPKDSFWRKHKKPVTIVGVVLLLITAVGVGALVRWLQQGGPSGGNNPNGGTQTTQDDGTFVGQRLPEEVSEVQDLNDQGKTEEANKLAEDQINNAATNNDIKYMLYIQQGNSKYNEGDQKAAIPYYEKALGIKETYEITQLLGEAYAATGDKPKAIEFYKKSLRLVPSDSPIADSEKSSTEAIIRSLGGQP